MLARRRAARPRRSRLRGHTGGAARRTRLLRPRAARRHLHLQTARPRRAAPDGEDDRLRRLSIRRRTPLGNEEFRAPLPHRPDLDGGYPTYRPPRTGEGADALGPLLVGYEGLRWPDPIPPARTPSRQTCRMVFEAPRAGVRVRYRFPREAYDEPDWQALDPRVREWIAARTTAVGTLR